MTLAWFGVSSLGVNALQRSSQASHALASVADIPVQSVLIRKADRCQVNFRYDDGGKLCHRV